MVRNYPKHRKDDICNGHYDPKGWQNLGKVCLARNLEPRIPEECLVTKLSYHLSEDTVRARLCSQIRTIQDMEQLLGNYEQENYYM